MAKLSLINRNKKRIAVCQKYRKKREDLRLIIADQSVDEEQRMVARLKLQSLPRDSSPTRIRNRCFLTGRARGYFRRFGLSRNKLRELAMCGEIPGLFKASW